MTLFRTRRWATALVAASLAVLPALVGASPASAAVTQQYFTYTGGSQYFTVPTGVTTIFVTAVGGSGGNGGSSTGHAGGVGGAGGAVSAAVPVTPGQKLDVWVGGVGGDGGTAAKGYGAGSGGLKQPDGSYALAGHGGIGDGGALARAGGGGGVTALVSSGVPLLAAGGGGGGGGANVLGGGGDGGSGGVTAGNGATGGGPSGGSGGAGAATGLALSGQNGQDFQDFNGGGGGGGSGWQVAGSPTGGGGGGLSEISTAFGTGGGGGGGAGATSAAAVDTAVHITTRRSAGNGSLFITWDQPATVTSLSTSGDQLLAAPVTLTASVAPATPVSGDPPATGTVTFYDGGSVLGTAPVSASGGAAAAVLTTSTLALGRHTITAAYVGDGVYAGSTSTASTVTIAAFSQFTSAGSAAATVGGPFSFLVQTWGYPYATITAAGPLDGLTLTGHPDGTATLAGRPAKAGTFPITFTADNGLNVNATQRFTLTVTLDPLTISTTTLPGAFTGQAYSAALGSAGGTPPVTWAVTAGKLPAGITLNPTTGALAGVPTTAGTSTFTVRATDATLPTHGTVSRSLTLAVTGIVPGVYVANGANDSVTSYPLGGSGAVAPATRLAGIAQGLNSPSGLVLDAAGRLYVSDAGSSSITEYDRGATAPTLTLAGPATGLAGPAGLTLDGSGRLVVADRTANAVRIYVPGVSGNTGPVVTLAGPATGLASPSAVAIDRSGRIWVADTAANSLTAYAAGATGDATPVVTIAGPATGLRSPQALTVDSTGHLVVANTFGASVTVYAPTASGNAAPLRTISGSATGIGNPSGIDVDTAGRIYVADQFANIITTYPGTANGDVAPLATIAGAATGISAPGALAVTPPLSVLTGRLPDARVGHRYAAALSAGQGTSPYRWALASGSLAPGLRLGANGAVTGVPTRAGSWTVTVRVTDSAQPATTGTRRLQLTVTR